MHRFIRYIPSYLPTALVLAAIFYLSLATLYLPDDTRLLLFPGADKVTHVIMYAGLTSTFCFDYIRRTLARRSTIVLIWATIAAIAISGVIELLQSYMGVGRNGDWVDMLANIIGAVVGIVAGDKCMRRWLC